MTHPLSELETFAVDLLALVVAGFIVRCLPGLARVNVPAALPWFH